MIAVFTTNWEQFNRLNCTPSNRFRRICRVDDLYGHRFVAVINVADWYLTDKETLKAINFLKEIQPEIFKHKLP